MRPILLFCLYCVFLLFLSCGNKEERAGKAAAEKVIEAITPARLTAFGQWAYLGAGNVWYKGPIAQVETTTRFEERNDSLILTVRKPEAFIKEFQLDIPLEGRLQGLTLVKSTDTCFFISEDALIGGYRWTSLDCSVDTVFKRGNPFLFFRDLTQFKDAHGIQAIEHLGGKAIQFFLADGYVLTYLPVGAVAGLDKKWQEELDRGEMIEDNWNLRRYNEQKPAP